MLTSEYLETVERVMRDRGYDFAAGLSEGELRSAEEVLGVSFPPDLRELLEHAVPSGERFPDWRAPNSAAIAERLDWPADGMCFDIEHNNFWLPEWGDRPCSLEQAKMQARVQVSRAPVLIPVYAHRYLPATPCRAGNPVFSVYQTDIIYYGHDLPSYLQVEFGVPNPFAWQEDPREIELWSKLERLDD